MISSTSRFSAWGCVFVAVLLTGSWAIAQDSAALLKQADTDLRAAERAMFSGKLDEAQTLLTKAAGAIDQLKAADANNPRVKPLEQKLAKLKADLEKRTSKPDAPAAPGGTSTAGGAGDKLPAAIVRRLNMIDASLNAAEEICQRDPGKLKQEHVQTAQSKVAEAVETMAGLMKDYGSKVTPGHPEIEARRQRIEAMQQKTQDLAAAFAANQQAADQAAAQNKALCDEWYKRLRMYVAGWANPDYDAQHSLVISPSHDPQELERQRKLYAEASVVLEEFKKVQFPGGKSDELAQAERDFEFHLKGLSQSIGAVSADAVKRADEQLTTAEEQLAAQEANTDPKHVPVPLRQGTTAELRELVNQATATAKDDPKVASFQQRLADIEKRDAALRELRKGRIIMKPDQFGGQELGDVKSKAAELVLKDNADVKVLSTTVISADWKEESVVEATDTTNTALRHRVTRSVTAQVAGKRDADVTLFTVHVAKDKRTDGTWGALYGNVMFKDAMLEKNVVAP